MSKSKIAPLSPVSLLERYAPELKATTEKVGSPSCDDETKFSHLMLICDYFAALQSNENPLDGKRVEILSNAVCAAPELLVRDPDVERAFSAGLIALCSKISNEIPAKQTKETTFVKGHIWLMEGALMKASEPILRSKSTIAMPERREAALMSLRRSLGRLEADIMQRAPKVIQDRWAELKARMDVQKDYLGVHAISPSHLGDLPL